MSVVRAAGFDVCGAGAGAADGATTNIAATTSAEMLRLPSRSSFGAVRAKAGDSMGFNQ